MKIFLRTAVALIAASLVAVPAANGQVSADGMGKMVPVELYACSFNDGQDAEDLDKVIERWTRFMDERETNTYAAWTLTPLYYGTEQEFDFIWMGAFADGNAFGTGMHQWLTEGGDIGEAFNRVADCFAHVGLSSAMYKMPPNNETPRSSILTMTDCRMKEGTRYEDVMAAEVKWAKYRTEQGSTAGTWHWFPQYGGGDADYDYKIVEAYADFIELGKDWERGANGGGREKSMSLFSHLDDCEDARIYAAASRRVAQLR